MVMMMVMVVAARTLSAMLGITPVIMMMVVFMIISTLIVMVMVIMVVVIMIMVMVAMFFLVGHYLGIVAVYLAYPRCG